jgi:hypothetical protein
MSSFITRLRKSGLNIMVLVISIAIFVVTFIALNGLVQAQKPPTRQVLAAAHSLDIGDVIRSSDITEKTVYEDENTALYIPVDQADSVIGGIVALPISLNHPIFKSAILAQASEDTRFSAALSQYPDYSLFPLPMDAMNILAPDISLFLPGDLVGLTVVIGDRPQVIETQAAPEELPGIIPTLSEADMMVTLAAYEVSKTKTPGEEALERSFPPMAKDLFPAGVRIIAIQGLPPDPAADGEETAVQAGLANAIRSQLLILLVPNQSREELALAMQQGDQLIVSLLARGEDITTPGFTYWDFEALFKSDRAEVLGITPAAEETVPPSSTPLAPPEDTALTPTLEITPTMTPTP